MKLEGMTLNFLGDSITEALPVCDLFKNSGMQPLLPVIMEKIIPDGIHTNDAGHVIIAARLGNFLANL